MTTQKSYGEYAREILEGRLSADEDLGIEAMTDSSIPTGKTADSLQPDEVRKNLDFYNENEDDVVDNNKSDETEMKTIDDRNETQNETQQRHESEPDTSTINTNDHVLANTTEASKPFTLVSDDSINFVRGVSNTVEYT